MSTSVAHNVSRIGLGAFLLTTGIGHLTFLRRGFRAQVPDFVPLPVDDTVVYSGIVELLLGSALVLAGKRKAAIGEIAAAFFIAVFPGNLAQYIHRRAAFGLDTDDKRLARLFVQPGLIYWALAATRER